MDESRRKLFDEQLEMVMAKLPPMVHELLEKIPLHVEDYPSARVMQEMGIRYRDELCGLYTGIPLGDKSITHSGQMPDVVTIYREGIWSSAADSRGKITPPRLRDEIHKTILHELAHHHGMTEEELDELGYG